MENTERKAGEGGRGRENIQVEDLAVCKMRLWRRRQRKTGRNVE